MDPPSSVEAVAVPPRAAQSRDRHRPTPLPPAGLARASAAPPPSCAVAPRAPEVAHCKYNIVVVVQT
eukprot:scaffold20944_cov106-Isochrysis_galbana.AAC.3